MPTVLQSGETIAIHVLSALVAVAAPNDSRAEICTRLLDEEAAASFFTLNNGSAPGGLPFANPALWGPAFEGGGGILLFFVTILLQASPHLTQHPPSHPNSH